MLKLFRGLPGSGKSTAAKETGALHIESDMYFIINGEYVFDGRRLSAAHIWCFETFEKAIKTGMDVCVSNTFTQYWELEPYIEFCKKHIIPYRIYEMKSQFGNIHGMPDEKMERMIARWEDISDKEVVHELGFRLVEDNSILENWSAL
jgi:tRNA uridine 5-carbamoylmethylation protein Kti12